MKCPTCVEAVLTMTERSGIEIDYCPTCRGVWLDRGELDKIIEKSLLQNPESTNTNRGSPREKIHDVIYKQEHFSDNEKFYKQKRKKSFLEEIFD